MHPPHLLFSLLAVPALFQSFSGAAAFTPHIASSQLMIQFPPSLYKSEGYEHREASFGRPSFFGSVSLQLYSYTVNDPRCQLEYFVDKVRPQYYGYSYGSSQVTAPRTPFLLMLDYNRNAGCSIPQLVRKAQVVGAAGVIFADTLCMCSDSVQDCQIQSSPNGYVESHCIPEAPLLVDDGSGKDITIPSFYMYKRDADKIKAELNSNHPVVMEMKWSDPQPNNQVEYEMFSSPTDPNSMELWKGFQTLAKSLGDRAIFTPHMQVLNGTRLHCRGDNIAQEDCSSWCTNNGRYCTIVPSEYRDAGITGTDSLNESLRRACIWSIYGKMDGFGSEWWDYMQEFTQQCGIANFSNTACIHQAYDRSNIQRELVEHCMEMSGGLVGDAPNSILEPELRAHEDNGVVVMPTAVVTKVAIPGRTTSRDLFQAICDAYETETQPESCKRCSSCGDPVACVNSDGVCNSNSYVVSTNNWGTSVNSASQAPDSQEGSTNSASIQDYPLNDNSASSHSFLTCLGWLFFVLGIFSAFLGLWSRKFMMNSPLTIFKYEKVTNCEEDEGKVCQ